ncbi:OmpA family protein [Psychrobacter sp. AOP22-C1-22]|uniref:OmpA family protein n=1 Tax=unclassified Psychrobacter TaxID=196806 RepID=UPI0017878368|nr:MULTISPECIES: OmpA family protein [unclassified Psychrobacter]MDN5801043.1 OmpA family protein [Psychrobacter sp.]MBE0406991.1 OmpA family protein [Psychrobacter sp. FME6]MBE0445825.1 OmpA family protein [Psychrobacter sp. FME5]MDN5891654.1 OmpA family protein [Psychrobacter sp.]MDN5898055.1 OmpA family protein [Psychrobacter sp.]
MRNTLMVAAVASGLALSGCATDPNTGQQRLNKTAVGTLAGALGGGAISKATGGDKTGRDAAIGAALGAGVGYYMERQAKQLEQQMAGTGVTVTPNPNGNIDLVMPGNITFSFDDATLNSSFKPTLNKLASTMSEYNQNTVTIAGHTDSRGSASYNQGLSRDRAYAVANYLTARGVASNRINVVAYGESRPIADNNSDSGRQQNRRVELVINAPQSVN